MCKGLASLPRGSNNSPSPFMLQKLELDTGIDEHSGPKSLALIGREIREKTNVIDLKGH